MPDNTISSKIQPKERELPALRYTAPNEFERARTILDIAQEFVPIPAINAEEAWEYDNKGEGL